MSTHNLCFERNYDKVSDYFLWKVSFLVVKFSVHLNRPVFIMSWSDTQLSAWKKRCIIGYSICTGKILVRCANAQAYLNLCWVYISEGMWSYIAVQFILLKYIPKKNVTRALINLAVLYHPKEDVHILNRSNSTPINNLTEKTKGNTRTRYPVEYMPC